MIGINAGGSGERDEGRASLDTQVRQGLADRLCQCHIPGRSRRSVGIAYGGAFPEKVSQKYSDYTLYTTGIAFSIIPNLALPLSGFQCVKALIKSLPGQSSYLFGRWCMARPCHVFIPGLRANRS